MSETLEAIAREIGENPVVIYMKGTPAFPMCGFSAATIEVLNQIGVPYKAIDVLAEGDKFVGGCDIVRELHARGELEPLIRTAASAHP